MPRSAHRFTYTEDGAGQIQTLAVDDVRWLSPREAAIQAQATADAWKQKYDEAQAKVAELEALMTELAPIREQEHDQWVRADERKKIELMLVSEGYEPAAFLVMTARIRADHRGGESDG